MFTLREYQTECVEAALARNRLVVLPTNSGKTVIAAECIRRTLVAENVEEGEVPRRKAVFLAPNASLAIQQYRVLLRHIDELRDEPSSDPVWRIGLVVGQADSRDEPTVDKRRAFAECQCVVITPFLLLEALIHARVAMADIALLVFDEAHRLRGEHDYRTIMKFFYRPSAVRPRVLGLSAAPVEKGESSEPCAQTVRELLCVLEHEIDATVWCWSDRIDYGQVSERVLEYVAPTAADGR